MESMGEVIHKYAIGASFAAPIVGASPFMSRWQAWAIITGRIEPQPETERMRAGKKFQQGVAEMFSEDLAIPFEWWDHPHYHPDREWQRATVDAFIPTIAQPKAVLEVKTTGWERSWEWGDTPGELVGEGDEGVPLHYQIQVQHQLSAHELEYGYVAVQIGFDERRYYRLKADPYVQEWLIAELEEFYYKNLVGGEEPTIDSSEAARQYLKRRFPREKIPLRPATWEEEKYLSEYARVRSEIAPLEDKRDTLEAWLKEAVGDAEGIEWANGRFTWKKAKGRVDWKKLAENQLVGYSKEERQAKLDEFTSDGSRVIHFWQREAA